MMPDAPRTPVDDGYRMPAEWSSHEATWLAWPHHAHDWPGKLSAIHWVYGEIVRKLFPGERVRILAEPGRVRDKAASVLRRAGVAPKQVEWFDIPTNRGWMRDTGPIFVTRDPSPRLAVADFHFNAWAKYPNWEHDDAVARRAADQLDLPRYVIERHGRQVVLEAGAIDVNGAGAAITTEQCLADPQTQPRNPGFTRQQTENVMREALGVTQVIWLGRGIVGDDTHGHVDDVCRFVGEDAVVLCREDDPADENYTPLEDNRERLEGVRLADGRSLDVVFLPMPQALTFNGRRLPASYANFYIANHAVLVPTFNDPRDREALGILGDLFPDRPVIGIHAVDLVWGLGTLHCLTQQQPET